MSNRVYVGDYGTEIILEVGTDVSTATTLKIQYEKPDGTTGQWDAAVYNTTFIKYTTIEDDIDQYGFWKFRAYVEMPSWVGYGETDVVEIYQLAW